MRHDDEPPAGVAHPVDVGRIEHRAGADENVRAECPRHDLDAAQGLRRVQRHLDDAEPALDQRLADGLRIFGAKDAQDRDQRKGGDVVAEEGHAAAPSLARMWPALFPNATRCYPGRSKRAVIPDARGAIRDLYALERLRGPG